MLNKIKYKILSKYPFIAPGPYFNLLELKQLYTTIQNKTSMFFQGIPLKIYKLKQQQKRQNNERKEKEIRLEDTVLLFKALSTNGMCQHLQIPSNCSQSTVPEPATLASSENSKTSKFQAHPTPIG